MPARKTFDSDTAIIYHDLLEDRLWMHVTVV